MNDDCELNVCSESSGFGGVPIGQDVFGSRIEGDRESALAKFRNLSDRLRDDFDSDSDFAAPSIKKHKMNAPLTNASVVHDFFTDSVRSVMSEAVNSHLHAPWHKSLFSASYDCYPKTGLEVATVMPIFSADPITSLKLSLIHI